MVLARAGNPRLNGKKNKQKKPEPSHGVYEQAGNLGTQMLTPCVHTLTIDLTEADASLQTIRTFFRFTYGMR